MNRGYVKLWRKSLDAGWIRNHKLWVFWTYCLMKANHKENFKSIIRNQEVLLQPGQFVFGRKVAAEETGLTEREIRTVLELLINWQNLTIRTTNRFSIITIVNWHIYQPAENENDQQNDQRSTSKRPHTRIKEIKIFLSDSIEVRLSELLLKKILSRNPNFKQPNIQSWAKDIFLMIRTDKRKPDDIQQVIEWCQNDPFWKGNVLSTQKLRKQFDQLWEKMGGIKKAAW